MSLRYRRATLASGTRSVSSSVLKHQADRRVFDGPLPAFTLAMYVLQRAPPDRTVCEDKYVVPAECEVGLGSSQSLGRTGEVDDQHAVHRNTAFFIGADAHLKLIVLHVLENPAHPDA